MSTPEKEKPKKTTVKALIANSFSVKTLFEFTVALQKILSVKGTGFSFICIENLMKIKPAQTEYEESVKKLNEEFYFKDEDKKPIKYLVQQKNILGEIRSVFKKDAQGEFVIAKDGEPFQHRINETEEYLEAVKKFNEKTYEITFDIISKNKFKELCEEGGPLDGIGPEVICLFDHIIK